jgi:hypothetical protein
MRTIGFFEIINFGGFPLSGSSDFREFGRKYTHPKARGKLIAKSGSRFILK